MQTDHDVRLRHDVQRERLRRLTRLDPHFQVRGYDPVRAWNWMAAFDRSTATPAEAALVAALCEQLKAWLLEITRLVQATKRRLQRLEAA